MKEKIKIVVVGNCQARPLAKILESLNPRIDVTTTAIVHLLKNENFEEYQPAFDEADLIVSQLVFDSYPCEFVRTSVLKERYGKKVLSIVNLYFTGYTPDWFYIRIPGKGPLKGPMGDYHNRTIFDAWQSGKSISEASSRILSEEYNQKYVSEPSHSLDLLREREEIVDVKITDVIDKYQTKKRLFFTFNHPSMFLIRRYAKRILAAANISEKWKFFPARDREALDQFVPLANPATGLPDGDFTTFKGVEYFFKDDFVAIRNKRKEYNASELVSCFYDIYETLDSTLNLSGKGN
ncbi:WcbI family polysaccharide biosynthesis putative acetyltransferase [Marinobacter sp. F4218]|uniref:WcbI family polysaccharide biosynthesis putative acetyltransferase n=1 Tax=Marinobacter sp. F4218 TaxID=2862868 RepID=UPI001C62B08D|nr:WcbI family polysaccharide biosynthesis putative acetyltransferase [Marinobacter sp. F4218]MBW7470472.1 hypothetical protein [Marinobacter sp. F4218]